MGKMEGRKMKKFKNHKEYLYTCTIITFLGIIITTTMTDTIKPIGIVFIAIGVILFVIGMLKKRKEDEKKNE